MQLDPEVKARIEGLIKSNDVVLFMKGNKQFPQCGFSATVVGILKELGVKFETANVLTDAGLRDGIKAFSDWPTIPQLYVKGEFVGGCDIVREMHASGELANVLGVKVEPPKTPELSISDAAARAFKAAEEPGEDKLRLEIDGSFQVDLYFAPKKPGDLEVTSNGVVVLIDAVSAKRADGVKIDYVDGPGGAGFKIENPNAPAAVRPISARELATMLTGAEPVTLLDVRTDKEREIAKIDGAIPFEGEGQKKLESLAKDAIVVFHCHHGVRSRAAAEQALAKGYKRVYNLTGGIDAWSREVDSSVAKY
ncbi:MAG: Grx4 family monothiol glutaredoxin [Polyangiaceae bacterium]|nr:Grx4 family monothiol glutaredoxin [Polyangiaceae bacterium]